MSVLRVTEAVFACHSAACAPPPAGKGGSSGGFAPPKGPAVEGAADPAQLGRPHSIPSMKYPGQHWRFDEKGTAHGLSSAEQAARYVKKRAALVKGMATRRRAQGK